MQVDEFEGDRYIATHQPGTTFTIAAGRRAFVVLRGNTITTAFSNVNLTGSTTSSNLLTSDMQNDTVTNNQKVQWFTGNDAVGSFKINGSNSGGMIIVDEYGPAKDAQGSRDYITQYRNGETFTNTSSDKAFAFILRNSSSSPATFSNVSLVKVGSSANLLPSNLQNASMESKGDQKVQEFGPGTYTFSGYVDSPDVSSVGVLTVDEWEGSNYIGAHWPGETFTIPAARRAYVILRAKEAKVNFSNVSLSQSNVQGVATAAEPLYTTHFRVAKSLAELNNAPLQNYDADPKFIDFTFSSTNPGTPETLYVQFIGRGGERETRQMTITYQPSFLPPQVSNFIDPQYLIVNKAGVGATPDVTCCVWSNQDPASIAGRAIDEIRDRIFGAGASQSKPDLQNPKRRLGVNFSLDYLNTSEENSNQIVDNLTRIAQEKDVPVLIVLEGNSWWDGRPDLWNWWDPNLPGYDPDNKNNVEWTSWDPNSAVKISWRNWGDQIRVKPAPNLGSPVYIAAKQEAINRLVPQIAVWYKNLPADKKYLLAGIVLDGELSIGLNAYYYPNGNDRLGQSEIADPKGGPESGTQPIGYAAVKSYGIRSSGTITDEDRNEAVRRHAAMLTQTARQAGLVAGVDLSDRLYIHGHQSEQPPVYPYSNALTGDARPGWSFYSYATNPASGPGLSSALDAIGNSSWAAIEWNPDTSNRSFSQSQWQNALNNTFNYRNNRLIAIYNWDTGNGIGINDKAVAAVRSTLAEQPSCLVTQPVLNNPQIDGRKVTFSWLEGQNSEGIYLNVSRDQDLIPSGNLRNANIINTAVTGRGSYTQELPDGTYFWNVTSDGCNASQRRVSETKSFTLQGSSIIPPIFDLIISPIRRLLPKPTNAPATTPLPAPTFVPLPKGGTSPKDFSNIRSTTYYTQPDLGHSETFLQDLERDIPKIKEAGFNTIWLVATRNLFDPNDTNIDKEKSYRILRGVLSLLKASGMKAMLPLSYGADYYSGEYCPYDKIHYPDLLAFQTEFLERIADYNDIVYVSVFTESAWGVCGSLDSKELADKVRPTLGNFPRQLPADLRSKFTIGLHDAGLGAGWYGGASPIQEPNPFDFISDGYYVNKEDYGKSDDQIRSDINQKVSNIKKHYPNTPVFFGEAGTGYCSPFNETKQAQTLNTIVSQIINKNLGVNVWMWRPLAPVSADCNFGGHAITYENGSLKPAGVAMKALFAGVRAPVINNAGLNTDFSPWAVWIIASRNSSDTAVRISDQGKQWGSDIPLTLSADGTGGTFQLPSNSVPSKCNQAKSCQITIKLVDKQSGVSSNEFAITLPQVPSQSSVSTEPIQVVAEVLTKPLENIIPNIPFLSNLIVTPEATPLPSAAPQVTVAQTDFNGDSKTNAVDLSILFSNWGKELKNSKADINGDSIVNSVDYTLFLKGYKK